MEHILYYTTKKNYAHKSIINFINNYLNAILDQQGRGVRI